MRVKAETASAGLRRGLAALAGGAMLLAGGWAAAETPAAQAPAPGMTPRGGVIGLVLTKRNVAVYETPGAKQECPDGFQHTNMENYRKQFPTEADRLAWEAKYSYPTNRGPNGENIFYFPMAAKDVLPFRDAKGNTAIGLNLDGKADANDFTSPQGETGVDNALYRVVGCMAGLRSNGVISGVSNRELRVSKFNRILLEISGIDDMTNDPDVTVTTLRGLDPLVEDVARNVVPGTTQRVDTRYSERFIHTLKGRIENGVLITGPKTVVLPSQQAGGTFTEQTLRDMQLRLKLTPQGAEGLMGAYLDVEEWWFELSRTWGAGQIGDITGWSPNATYEALHRYADAYPDAKTGANTAISAAYTMTLSPVFIVHPAGASPGRQVAAR